MNIHDQHVFVIEMTSCKVTSFTSDHDISSVSSPLGPVHFLSSDQQSGIHCLIICAIQQLITNNLGGTRRRICLPDIRSVST